MKLETRTKKIIARLLREGWVDREGGKHQLFVKPGHRTVAVPRHVDVSIGVARDIAKRAGWQD